MAKAVFCCAVSMASPFQCLRRLKVSGFKVQSSMATPFLKKRNVMLDLFQHLIPLFCSKVQRLMFNVCNDAKHCVVTMATPLKWVENLIILLSLATDSPLFQPSAPWFCERDCILAKFHPYAIVPSRKI